MFDKKVFGEKIKDIRIKANLQQDEFGDIIGLTKQTISNMENGRKGTSIEVVYEICKHFNVSADYLLGLKDNDRD